MSEEKRSDVRIVFEDHELLVISKPAGIAVQENGNDDIETLFPTYYVLHRLDQRVSGLLLLAKNKKSAAALNLAFSENQVEKKYRAIVLSKPTEKTQCLESWIKKTQNKALVSKTEKPGFQKARLSFTLISSSERYHLLQIDLETGRFHQIRAQLAHFGCPIVGDLKYGFPRSSPDGSIFLHAYALRFRHPSSGESLLFEIENPSLWTRYGF
jgi:23S rRNA pseudouridine1911/1915/1917 synthase